MIINMRVVNERPKVHSPKSTKTSTTLTNLGAIIFSRAIHSFPFRLPWNQAKIFAINGLLFFLE